MKAYFLYELVIPECSKYHYLKNWIQSVELIGVLMRFIWTFAYYALWSMKQLEPKVVFVPTICVYWKEKVNRVLKPTIEFSRLSSIFYFLDFVFLQFFLSFYKYWTRFFHFLCFQGSSHCTCGSFKRAIVREFVSIEPYTICTK